MNKTELRRFLRAQRNQLSSSQQKRHANDLLSRLTPWLKKAHKPLHIALYLAQDGELETQPLAMHLMQLGHFIYLPVITRHTKQPLYFAPWTAQSQFRKNKYAIPEPLHTSQQCRKPQQLDLVLMPLVGFDRHKNRLGMGGGFYDRSFAFKHKHPRRGPQLIGLAHECQKVAHLTIESWDVPLDAVLSDKRSYR